MASAQPGDDPKIAALKTDAQKAIEAGQLAEADALLANVEMEEQHRLERLTVNTAETSARRGDLALTRLRYGEAAKHFANAAALFPPNSAHEDKRISYLQKRRAPSTSRATNSAITVLCFRHLSDTTGWFS